MDDRIATLRSQVRLDPRSRLFFQLGEALRREGEEREAAEVLRAGLEHHPRYVAAWVALGRALYSQEAWGEAGAAFATALELDPENPVAAAMLGRSAMGREAWEEAVRSLKLARALGPSDDELEADLATVEARLREQGLLIGDGVAESPPPLPEDVAGSTGDDHGQGLEPRPAFADGRADPFAVTQPFIPAPTTVTMVSPEDPFDLEVDPSSGAFRAGEDVFTLGGDAAEDAAIEDAGPFDAASGLDFPAPPDEEGLGEAPAEPLADDEPPFEPVADEADGDDIPLPTITLARLAIDQGDLELARRTLEGVLEHEPGSAEARELLQGLAAETPSRPSPAPDPNRARIAALQTWLEDIRLAAETGSS